MIRYLENQLCQFPILPYLQPLHPPFSSRYKKANLSMQLYYARSDNSLCQAGYQSTTRTLRRPCSSFSFLYDEAIESLPFRHSISATVRDAVLPLPESSLLLLSRIPILPFVLWYPFFLSLASTGCFRRALASQKEDGTGEETISRGAVPRPPSIRRFMRQTTCSLRTRQ